MWQMIAAGSGKLDECTCVCVVQLCVCVRAVQLCVCPTEDSRFRLSVALIEHKSAPSEKNLQIYCQAAWEILWLSCTPCPPPCLLTALRPCASTARQKLAKLCEKSQLALAISLSLSRFAQRQSGQHATNFVSSGCQKRGVRALPNSSKTFLNNLAQELKIANAAQHAKSGG